MDHFPFVAFHGSPWQLGWSHGEHFRESVRRQLAETLEAADKQGQLSRTAALAWSEQQLPKIARLGPHWIDELKGLAAGAEISLAEAAALQVRPGTGAMPEGCTSFGVCNDAATGGPLAGQNRDLAPIYRERMFVMLLKPERGAPILMHNVPGEIGGCGINGHGVCVFANTLWARSGRTWMAPPVLRRAVLECATADEAVKRIRGMDRPAVGNFLIADAAGRVRNLEILPEALAVMSHDSGVFAHANNCIDEGAKQYECEPNKFPSPGSEPRRVWLSEQIERRKGALSVAVLKELLSSHECQPEPLCRHSTAEHSIETATAMIAEPAAAKLHLSFGPPCEGKFREFAAKV